MSREYTRQRAPSATAINIDYAVELNERQLVDSYDSLRHDEGDDLPAILAISSKIAVGREHDGFLILLRHPNQARVGETHGSILIATDKAERFRELIRQGKIDTDNRALEQPGKRVLPATRAFQKEKAFGKHGFTSDERLHLCLKVRSRPGMMLIASAQRGDNRATIDEDGFGHTFSDAPCSRRDRREVNRIG